ncbi:hypothetical protein A3A48_02570 [Candidatus Curtissbacteria bacterium RIFCSPLOWO2_01_FULL_37_9]|uniref:Glycosyltransferase RgtA/B/C/D-like domain-containing protein n=1 Tax=Candidatus Curtissbacteria bacterium RIFCSPLOWO2_01_FULL_37_9 TaxID=1797724 RepID=A0A1F5GQY0_9BACT|nr:MAG: hypothetical protein A3A48_02570 [Candidatus Curtissbacteria bacterium RIFCSPLOWO2_01_FULL_37_9]
MTTILLIFSALLLRLVLSPYGSLPIDMADWIGWSNRLVEIPFKNFYDAWSDYLPGYLYVLWFLGHIKNFFYGIGLTIPLEIIYKLPAILADLTLVFVAYKISKKFFDQKIALVIAAIFAFNPAIFANSSLWGQIDVLNTLFYILTFILLIRKRILLSGVILAISLLIKPQGVFLLPFVLLIVIKDKWRIFEFIKGVFVSLLLFVGAFISFSNKLNILQFIFERYSVSLNQYQYTSVNAFNFWAIGQRWWRPDSQIWLGIPLQYWGMAIFSVISGLILWNFWKKYKTGTIGEKLFILNFSLALIFLGSFIFLTRVHERLLLTPLIFLMLAAIFKKDLWIFVGILSITYVANLYFSFVWITDNFRYVFNEGMINIICTINISVFVILLVILLKERFHFDDSKTA